jgi:hypothetical protein
MSEHIVAIRKRLEAWLECLIVNAGYEALKDMHRDLLRQMSNDKVVESTLEVEASQNKKCLDLFH